MGNVTKKTITTDVKVDGEFTASAEAVVSDFDKVHSDDQIAPLKASELTGNTAKAIVGMTAIAGDQNLSAVIRRQARNDTLLFDGVKRQMEKDAASLHAQMYPTDDLS